MRARRSVVVIAALLVAALLLLILWVSHQPPVASPRAATTLPSGARVSMTGQPTLGSGSTSDATAPRPVGPTEDEVQAFRHLRVASLRKAARYPGDSGPLTARHREALTLVFPDSGAVTGDDELHPDSEGRQIQLVAYATKPHFQIDEPAVLHAEVRNLDADRRVPAKVLGTLRKLVGGPHRDALANVLYRDDGQGGDPIANDLIYTAVVTTKTIPAALLAGQIDVEVSATLTDGRNRVVLSVFRMGSPGARLTGEFADRLEAGHLMIDAKVIVEKPGRYHLQGGLVGSGGELVAWSQNAVMLDTVGPTSMHLRFFGLAFHDAGIPGPYRLAFISIAETQRRPVLQGPVLVDAHTTAAYRLADFAEDANHDPAMDATIKQAEDLTRLPYAEWVTP